MAPRLRRASARHNTKDAVGTVRVTVVLVDPARRAHRTGNIVRVFHLQNTKVSVAAEQLTHLWRTPE